ncbi:hypothetical protein AYO41_00095 [Verrucomicrobia bacterium SCGC AG-212-E04]|nr:hypothetical protein AYO41_00095 [Verrucomicrobia bacterium SCGC AG-212-E04]
MVGACFLGLAAVTAQDAAPTNANDSAATAADSLAISSLLTATSPTGGSSGAGLAGFAGFGQPNLFALGQSNTLTLINGRRALSLPSVNAIPLFALSRVEATRFGPSIANGSDALGGTVNFVLLDGPGAPKYSGSEIDLFYGSTGKGGSARGASFTTGFTSEKLSMVFGASYYRQDGLALSDGRLSPYANASLQNSQYFAAFDYKLYGRAMQLYGDFLISDTKVDGVRSYSRSARAAVSGGTDLYERGYNSRYYRATVGLKGQIPTPGGIVSGVNYDVGVVFDEGKVTGFDETDVRRPAPRRSR